MGQAEGKRIAEGHPEYEAVYRDWQLNGCPNGQFDRSGDWGGALYEVRREGGEVVFYQIARGGPTVVDDETGKVEETGWQFFNDKYWRIESREDPDGRVEIQYVGAPNDGEIRLPVSGLQ